MKALMYTMGIGFFTQLFYMVFTENTLYIDLWTLILMIILSCTDDWGRLKDG